VTQHNKSKTFTNNTEILDVVTVAGICNSVGVGVFLTRHCGAGGEYQSVSRLGLLIRNRWMSRLGDQIVPAILECANCSLHATAGAALSETVASVSLSAVPRRFLLPGSFANGQADVRERAGGVADWTDLPCIQVGSNDAAFR